MTFLYAVISYGALLWCIGQKVTDLHRESIDHLEIPSRVPGRPPLRRIPEVFDCWFESGSMPYAQQHFPFENAADFHERFPADFVAEGIDQTRGWFYTLLVLSSALFGRPPFKNLIASGLVLASDGQKMSKRKRNYPDPAGVVSRYGADALRLYLVNSPAVRAENLRFKEEGVRDVVRDVFLPWFNTFRFLMQNLDMYARDCGEAFRFLRVEVGGAKNLMDGWILSFTESLVGHVHREMGLYRLYNVVPRLIKYFDHLTNWYVRMNRKRLKGEDETDTSDRRDALTTLFDVLLSITKLMSPFAPFFSEYIYQNLKGLTQVDSASIHYLMLPDLRPPLVNKGVEKSISRLQDVVELTRLLRDKNNLPIKYPLPELVVVHQDLDYLTDLALLKPYIISELNIRKLTLTSDKEKFGVKLVAKPDYKALGTRFKSDYKLLAQTIEALTDTQINQLDTVGLIVVSQHQIERSFVRLIFKTEGVALQRFELQAKGDLLVLLDVKPDRAMLDEGAAREVISRVQKLRKKAHLVPSDQIVVYYRATNDLKRVVEHHLEFIQQGIRASFRPVEGRRGCDQLIVEESRQFKKSNLYVMLTCEVTKEVPVAPWANLLLEGFDRTTNCKGLILLQVGSKVLTLDGLKHNVRGLFDLDLEFVLWSDQGEITHDVQVGRLSGKTVWVLPPSGPAGFLQRFGVGHVEPFCQVMNFSCRGVVGTVILENPVGVATVAAKDVQGVIDEWVRKVLGKADT